jgi:hypothetical protein
VNLNNTDEKSHTLKQSHGGRLSPLSPHKK